MISSSLDVLSDELFEKLFLYFEPESTVCKRWNTIYAGHSFAMHKARFSEKQLAISSFLAFTSSLEKPPAEEIHSLRRALAEMCVLSEEQKVWAEKAPVYKVIELYSKQIKIKQRDLVLERALKAGPSLRSIKELNLSGLHLTSLPIELKECVSLEFLNLSSERFTKISGKILNCFTQMTYFYMDSTPVEKLPKTFGKTWEKLEVLSLAFNHLKELPPTFAKLLPKLTCIRLMGNNLPGY